MGRGKHGTDVFRGQVQAFRDLGLNNSEIARKLGCSCKKVINAINLFNDTGSLSNKKRKSRERKTTPREEAAIARIAKLNPFVGAPKIKEQIAQNLKLDLSVSTVKSHLRENKLFGRVARKKPLVSKLNLVSRLKFAKQHVHKVFFLHLSFWQNVLWTDESKFNRFGSDGKQYVRRPQNQELSPRYTLKTVKHVGGNVIVWGSFSWCGVGPLHRIRGTMDQHMYKEILEKVMLPYAEDNLPLVWKFQQDNDPKHTAKSVKMWFNAKKINVLERPAQSPDLNPIENLWEEVDRNINRSTATNLDRLWIEIKAAWDAITPERCQKLISSMGCRCQAVIDSKGYPTKY